MAVVMTGTAISQVIAVLTTPIISRLYEPAMFGVFGVYNSVIVMISMVSTLRYDHALMLPKNDADASNLLVVSFLCVMFFSLSTLIGCLIFKNLIHSSMNVPEIDLWPILIPLAVLLLGVYQSISAWSVRKKLFKLTATSHVSRSVVSSLVKLVAGLKNPHAIGLISGHLSGELVANLNVIYRGIVADRFILKSSISFGRMKTLAKENLDFAVYGSGQLLIGAAALQVPILLMAKYYGSTTVGFYSFALSIIQFPLIMVQNSLRQVFFQKACETFNKNGDIYTLLKKTTLGLYAIFLFPALLIFIFGPALFALIFGKQWVTAGIFAQYIIPAAFIAFPKVPTAVLTRIYRKQRQVFILESIALTAEIILYTQLAERIVIINMLILHTVIRSIFNITLIGWMFKVAKEARHPLDSVVTQHEFWSGFMQDKDK